jgi:HK97 gp10 family phage protein
MAVKVTMTLTGFEALQRALRTAPETVRSHASQAVATSAFSIAQRARALVPVDTGHLKAAIEANRTAGGLTGSVGVNKTADAYYWRFVEFGTRNMAARPFFRPAAEEEEPRFVQRMREIGTKLERDLSTGRFT